MKEDDFGKVFADNLNRLLEKGGKRYSDLSDDLGIPKTTISNWVNNNNAPKMKTIDILCEYFNVTRVDLMYRDGIDPYEEKGISDLAREIYQNDALHALILSARGIPKEKLLAYAELISKTK